MRFKSLEELRKTKVGALPINEPLFALAPVEDRKRERDPLSALVKKSNGEYKRETSVGYCITILSLSHKISDSDNHITGAKPLRDAIAASLGVDDSDKRIVWQYLQVVTRGAEGTLVEISTIKPPWQNSSSKSSSCSSTL